MSTTTGGTTVDSSDPTEIRRRWRRQWRAIRQRAAFPAFAIGLALLAGLALARMG